MTVWKSKKQEKYSGLRNFDGEFQKSWKVHILFFILGLTSQIFPEGEIHRVFTVGINNRENLVLPCYTSLPDIPVFIYKRRLIGDLEGDLQFVNFQAEFSEVKNIFEKFP